MKIPTAVVCIACVACIMLIAFLFLLLSGCDQTSTAKAKAYEKPHTVVLWSGGKAVRQWRSRVRPLRDSQGSSLMGFVDDETGTYVMLRGTISVEQTE